MQDAAEIEKIAIGKKANNFGKYGYSMINKF